jgi:hypothetical protein
MGVSGDAMAVGLIAWWQVAGGVAGNPTFVRQN